MDFPDFRKIREDAHRAGIAARMSADDGTAPEVGRVYTVSPDFICGDRSWTEDFWEVLGLSGPNVLARIHRRHETLTRMCRLEDRAWYPADDLFAIFSAEKAGSKS